MYEKIEDAARAWVSQFTVIPGGIIEKLLENNPDELVEITPPTIGDRVYVIPASERGEVISFKNGKYKVRVDGGEDDVCVDADEIEVERECFLPMWSVMWAFHDDIDNEWLNGEYLGPHLQEMANCGFRIYEQEDYGYIFGIDGAGYSFFEAHFVPLYKARGLHWHTEEVA